MRNPCFAIRGSVMLMFVISLIRAGAAEDAPRAEAQPPADSSISVSAATPTPNGTSMNWPSTSATTTTNQQITKSKRVLISAPSAEISLSIASEIDEIEALPEGIEPADLAPGETLVYPAPENEATSKLPAFQFGDWWGYHAESTDTTWLAAGDEFGMFSLQSYPSLSLGQNSAVKIGTGFHFLNGPAQPEMPPRLFDLQLAFLHRGIQSDRWMIDYRFSVGVFSDFEGSARKGVRFPGHVVSYYDVAPDVATVFGVEVFDRDDVSLLPVVGVVLRPTENIVAELIFPRPRVQVRYSETRAFYVAGELGGDTWAIERTPGIDDVATYSDLRVTLGFLELDDPSDSAFEIGYAFDRQLDYRGTAGRSLDGALILRFRRHF